MFGIHSIEYDGLASFFYLFAALENGSDWLAWDHVTELADEVGVPAVPIRCQKQVNCVHQDFMWGWEGGKEGIFPPPLPPRDDI